MPADDVQVQMVRDELARISDAGDLASRADLRERVGIGAGDLENVLAQLREQGVATEVEPDGYRLVTDDDGALSEDGATPEPGMSLAEAERGTTGAAVGAAAGGLGRERVTATGQGATRIEFGREATVTMPRAMVDAMEPAVLGGILKAGIESADGDSFVFEVVL